MRKLKDFSSQAIINLTKQIFGEQEIPQRLMSDNGPHNSSTLFKQFSREWGFEHYTSSLRYPQSNGLAERCVQAIKSAMQKAASSNRDLDMVLLCLQSTPIDHVISSPGCCCLVFCSLSLLVISCLWFVFVILLCFGLVVSLRCLLFLTSLFPFSSLIMYRRCSNFSMTTALFQYWLLPYGCTVTWSPSLNSIMSWAFLL